MRTNIFIDDKLLAEFMAGSGAKTKREAIYLCAEGGGPHSGQLRALDALRGIGWDGDLDDMRTSKYIPAE
ncbi:type II toxin-antitoxin system VapB family antitoxin [Sphingomonas sp. MMS24-JH45]